MINGGLTCSGKTPAGQTCGARMRLCSSRSGKIMPFFRAETFHALGCDEGAWNAGPEVVAAFDALRDGRAHPTVQWLEALGAYLQAGSPNRRDMNSYLGQWSEGQWQAWADYRNALATGSAYEAPCIPVGLSKLLGFPIMPADMTAPFPYLGFICCGIQELFEADKRFGNRVIVSNSLFMGPTLPDLAQAQQQLKALSEDANWWLEVTVLLLPQPNGRGVLAEVSEVLLAVNTDSEPALADVNLDGLFPQTEAQTYTCCGTHAWRWE